MDRGRAESVAFRTNAHGEEAAMGGQLVTKDFDALTWLQDWFADNCDGEWEGQWNVQLTSTDDPGWFLSIPVQDTILENRPFRRIDHNRKTDAHWWICQVG